MKNRLLVGVSLIFLTSAHAQNVGIGTGSPAAKLHISTNSFIGSQQIRLEETEADYSRFGFSNSGTTKSWELAAISSDNDANSRFNVYNSSTGDLLTVRGNGNIGVGVFSPAYKLDVAGRLRLQHSTATAGVYFDGVTQPTRSFIGTLNDDYIGIWGGGGASWNFAMNVNNGYVGIGNSTPAAKLHITGNSSIGTQQIRIEETQNDYSRFGWYNSGTTKSWELAAISSDNDENSRFNIYNSSTGDLVTVRGNGNVGVGEFSPLYKLDVAGRLRLQHAGGTAGIYFDGSTLPTRSFIGTLNDDHMALWGAGGAGYNFVMNVNNGNVGIGEQSPAFKLDLNGRMRLKHTTNTAGIYFDGTSQPTRSFIGTFDNDHVGIYGNVAGWNFVMNVENGNIGIGNSAPEYPLNFSNTLGDKISLWNSGNNNYGIGLQSNLLQFHTAGSNDDIAFGYGNSAALTELMRIRGNGKVGIGTSAPASRLHIADNSVTGTQTLRIEETENDFARIGYYNSGTTKYWETVAISSDNDANSEFNIFNSSTINLFTVKGDGKIGIGTTTPAAKLEVNGFTKMGSDAPAVKVKKITGTMNATATQVVIPHGLNSAKILSVSVLVEYVSGTVSYVPGGYTVAAGYEYNYHITGTNIVITPVTGNCSNILSRNIKAMVTYEE